MATITRTFIEFRCTALTVKPTGPREAIYEEHGTVNIVAPHVTNTSIRKAFREAGIDLPQSCIFEKIKVAERKFVCSDDEFMSIAHEVTDE